MGREIGLFCVKAESESDFGYSSCLSGKNLILGRSLLSLDKICFRIISSKLR